MILRFIIFAIHSVMFDLFNLREIDYLTVFKLKLADFIWNESTLNYQL